MNETAIGYKCSHEGCNETENLTACYYPDDGTPEEELFAGHYCYDHAPEAGFCYGCGFFWSGVESFDFPESYGNIRGYCENCSFDIRESCGEFDEREDPYY